MKPTNITVITGGAQGIGRGTARYLLHKGYQVALLDCDGEALDEASKMLSQYGNCKPFQVDVSSETEVADAVGSITSELGPPRWLMNNAGISHPFLGHPSEINMKEWQRMIGVNLTGAMICAKHCIPHLKSQHGSIVNIASTRALMSEPNSEGYAATKGGLLALTHALAVSLGPEITVNAISPGWIDVSGEKRKSQRKPFEPRDVDHTQHPAGRIGKVEDIASLTAYLFSDESRFITGENFVVDGGMTRKMIYEH